MSNTKDINHNTTNNNLELNLINLIQYIISKDKKIEESRNKISYIPLFDSFACFRAIDKENRGYLTKDDVYYFMKKWKDNITIQDVELFLQYLKNSIPYNMFLKIILPQKDLQLKQKIIEKHNNQGSNFDINQMEKIIADIFEKEIRYYEELHRRTKDLMTSNTTIEDLFTLLDNKRKGFCDFQCLNQFMKNHGIQFTQEDHLILLRRLKKKSNEDNKITMTDLKSVFLSFNNSNENISHQENLKSIDNNTSKYKHEVSIIDQKMSNVKVVDSDMSNQYSLNIPYTKDPTINYSTHTIKPFLNETNNTIKYLNHINTTPDPCFDQDLYAYNTINHTRSLMKPNTDVPQVLQNYQIHKELFANQTGNISDPLDFPLHHHSLSLRPDNASIIPPLNTLTPYTLSQSRSKSMLGFTSNKPIITNLINPNEFINHHTEGEFIHANVYDKINNNTRPKSTEPKYRYLDNNNYAIPLASSNITPIYMTSPGIMTSSLTDTQQGYPKSKIYQEKIRNSPISKAFYDVSNMIKTRDKFYRANSNPIRSSTSNPVGFSTSNPMGSSINNPMGSSTSNPIGYSISNPIAYSTGNPIAYLNGNSRGYFTSNPIAYSTDNPRSYPIAYSNKENLHYNYAPAPPLSLTNPPYKKYLQERDIIRRKLLEGTNISELGPGKMTRNPRHIVSSALNIDLEPKRTTTINHMMNKDTFSSQDNSRKKQRASVFVDIGFGEMKTEYEFANKSFEKIWEKRQ